MLTESYFNPYNIYLNSRYIVYLSENKFASKAVQSRKLISKTDRVKNISNAQNLFAKSKKIAIITDSNSFLELYEKDIIIGLSEEFDLAILAKLHSVSSDNLYILESTELDQVISKIIDFCIKQWNDLILVDLESGKTFISKNSYYLTNIITENELEYFPVTYIEDSEVIDRMQTDFQDCLAEMI